MDNKQREVMELMEAEGFASREELVSALQEKNKLASSASTAVARARLATQISDFEGLLRSFDEAFPKQTEMDDKQREVMELMEAEGFASRGELVSALEDKSKLASSASTAVARARLATKISDLEFLLRSFDEAFSATPVHSDIQVFVERMTAFRCANSSELAVRIEDLEYLIAKCSDFLIPKQLEVTELMKAEGFASKEALVAALEEKSKLASSASTAIVRARLATQISELEGLLRSFDEAFSPTPIDPVLRDIRDRMKTFDCEDSCQLNTILDEMEKLDAEYRQKVTKGMPPSLSPPLLQPKSLFEEQPLLGGVVIPPPPLPLPSPPPPSPSPLPLKTKSEVDQFESKLVRNSR